MTSCSFLFFLRFWSKVCMICFRDLFVIRSLSLVLILVFDTLVCVTQTDGKAFPLGISAFTNVKVVPEFVAPPAPQRLNPSLPQPDDGLASSAWVLLQQCLNPKKERRPLIPVPHCHQSLHTSRHSTAFTFIFFLAQKLKSFVTQICTALQVPARGGWGGDSRSLPKLLLLQLGLKHCISECCGLINSPAVTSQSEIWKKNVLRWNNGKKYVFIIIVIVSVTAPASHSKYIESFSSPGRRALPLLATSAAWMADNH